MDNTCFDSVQVLSKIVSRLFQCFFEKKNHGFYGSIENIAYPGKILPSTKPAGEKYSNKQRGKSSSRCRFCDGSLTS